MADNDRILCASGVRIPRIIYGTAWKKLQTEPLVALALQHGFRGIDTACQPKHYHEAVSLGKTTRLFPRLVS
ncbi:MAG TPA: hypothetical protein VMH32_11960 [Burkholderiales bacterium]|nr:hypothetical protein [Burkholderiales bacterium]